MRRPIRFVLPALLAVTMLAAPTGAWAAEPPATTILAVESDAEPSGPDPMPRDRAENPAPELAGYEDKDLQFTWGAAWILMFLGLVGLVVMVIVYVFKVDRPGREPSEEPSGRS